MILFVLTVILFIATLLIMWLVWLFEKPVNAIYIRFKTFISFYNINPDRWELDDACVLFKKDEWYDCIRYKFHFIDYYRYRHWYEKIIKQRSLQKEVNDMSEMIRIIKSDIAKFEEENQCQIEKATSNIKEIISRM